MQQPMQNMAGVGAQPAAGGAPQMPVQALTEEQTRQMQLMSKQAMELLLEEATTDQILRMAESGDPQQAIAKIVTGLLDRLYEAASNAGQQIEMVTMLVTGIQIIGVLAELLVTAGVIQEQDAPAFIGAVSKIAVDAHNARVGGGGAQQQNQKDAFADGVISAQAQGGMA
jgi:hypothetical protein